MAFRVGVVGWCGVVLCVAAVSLVVASPAGAVAGYGDVADGRYYTEAVQWSVDRGITGIDGNCFSPDEPVSRGEAAVYIWNMEGQPSAPDHPFVDVIDERQDAAVSWMSHNEITSGTSPTTFSPDSILTRAQLLTFLWRLAGEPAVPDHPFFDVRSAWQQGSVSWAFDSGITTGTSPIHFGPNNTLTRARLVTFLWRYQGQPKVTVDPASPLCDPAVYQTVSAGSWHSCGLRAGGRVICWGRNDYGQSDVPVGVFQAVSAGWWHSCGVRVDGTLICWGYNKNGQSDAPEGVFQAVSARLAHSCGLRVDGTVICWGYNKDGQSDAPVGVFQAVSPGSWHSCGLRVDGTLICWGSNYYGQSDAPMGVFQAVSAGTYHSCGLRVDGSVTCWGRSHDAQRDR